MRMRYADPLSTSNYYDVIPVQIIPPVPHHYDYGPYHYVWPEAVVVVDM